MVKLGTFFNRINLAIALIPCCLLIGCKDNSLSAPALKTAALVGSADASAELLEESTGNVFALTINGAKISTDFTPEQITSVCALAFYNELTDNQRSENCFVRVSISPEKGKPVQATYTCEELTIADRCIDHASEFFRWHPAMGLDSIRPAVDPLFFPDSLLEQIGQSILTQDSADNAWLRTEIMGFRQDTVANIPVLVLNAKAVRKQKAQWYDAYARYSNQQLLFVAARMEQD
ncbi:MAG: hypothetical protein ACK478_11620 [Flavobacteriales bacterium]|jgi:hypothetical protein